MSVKRQATTELNHDNWDQDDPTDQEEEGGGFKMASKEILEKRVFRTAKRRSQATGDEPNRSVFSGFSGFNKTQKTSFDFLAKLTDGNQPNNNTSTTKSDVAETSTTDTNKLTTSPSRGLFSLASNPPKSTFGKQNTEAPLYGNIPATFSQSIFTPQPNATVNASPFKIQNTQNPLSGNDLASKSSDNADKSVSQASSTIFGKSPLVGNTSSKSLSTTPSNNISPFKTQLASSPQTSDNSNTVKKTDLLEEKKQVYYNKLKGLNQCVSAWIKKHVDDTPLCILSPIFKDYEKHLSNIQDEYEKIKNQFSKENTEAKENNVNRNLLPQSNNNIESPFTAAKSNAITSNTSNNTVEKSSNFAFGTSTTSAASATSSFSTSSSTAAFSFGVKPSTTQKSNAITSNISNNTVEKSSNFTFGISTTPAASSTNSFSTSSSTAGFSFDVKPSTTQKSNAITSNISNNTVEKSSNFTFGISTTPAASSTNSFSTSSSTAGFSFDVKPSTTQKSNAITSNISNNTVEKSSNFKFGISTTPAASSTNSFSTSSSTAGFSFDVKPSTTQKSNAITSNISNNIVEKSSNFTFGISTTPAASSTSSFSTSTTTTPSSAGFSFGVKPTTQTSPCASSTAIGSPAKSPFSFGTGKPFTFNSNIQKPEEPSQQTEENEDEPPKVEYTPIVEDNSVFDKKCKVFFKKDGNFVDKGVGTLYIKKVEESGKFQLLVRANTSLGNILLNFILNASITMQRMGKNNVMIVCIPTPDAQPPPTPVLIRVKASEEADELLETLNKYKV